VFIVAVIFWRRIHTGRLRPWVVDVDLGTSVNHVRTEFTRRRAKTSFPASYDVDRATNGLRVSVTEAQGEQ
jgi:hypothetical protein